MVNARPMSHLAAANGICPMSPVRCDGVVNRDFCSRRGSEGFSRVGDYAYRRCSTLSKHQPNPMSPWILKFGGAAGCYVRFTCVDVDEINAPHPTSPARNRRSALHERTAFNSSVIYDTNAHTYAIAFLVHTHAERRSPLRTCVPHRQTQDLVVEVLLVPHTNKVVVSQTLKPPKTLLF